MRDEHEMPTIEEVMGREIGTVAERIAATIELLASHTKEHYSDLAAMECVLARVQIVDLTRVMMEAFPDGLVSLGTHGSLVAEYVMEHSASHLYMAMWIGEVAALCVALRNGEPVPEEIRLALDTVRG